MFQTSKYPIGLDISDTSLKLVQLKKQGGVKFGRKNSIEKLEINCYNTVMLLPGQIINGEIKKESEVIKSINKLISTTKCGKISDKNIVAVLPATQTFIKLISIPNTPENELQNAIKEEIVKHIPQNLNEVYLDWQVINKTNDTLEVLVGTAPKYLADQYTELIEKSKLQPVALEIEAVCICRSLIAEAKKNTESEIHMIIDLGANRSSVILCSDKVIYLATSAPISGDETTKLISGALDLDMKKAEKAKKVCGLSAEKCKGAVREILDEMVNNLIDHTQRASSFFQSNYPEKKISSVILCGGGASFIDIDKILFSHLKIPITKGDPWLKINKDETQHDLINNDLSYVTAIGLALRDISNNR